jgi:hypothetical protein
MNDLIEALQILSKYGNPDRPTHCEHDVLTINPEISPILVSEEDINKLEELGFFVSVEYGEELFMSFRFGSC